MIEVTRAERLADAGLAVLAAQGMRGLTHRAVDAEAGVPQGTCSNYFRTREELIVALGRRIFERLTPDEEYLRDRAAGPPTRDQWVRLMVELFERARAAPELHLALLELRLEATRRLDRGVVHYPPRARESKSSNFPSLPNWVLSGAIGSRPWSRAIRSIASGSRQ